MSSNDSEEQDVRIITSSHDLDDYDIIATNLMSVAVPHQTNEEFRKMIWAAMVPYSAGNSSVDNVLRRWKVYWNRRSDKSFQLIQSVTVNMFIHRSRRGGLGARQLAMDVGA